MNTRSNTNVRRFRVVRGGFNEQDAYANATLAAQLAHAEDVYQACARDGDQTGMDWWGCAVYDLRAALARVQGGQP